MQHLVRVACALFLGCAPASTGIAPLVLQSVRPGEGVELFLNEPLTLVFSEPLDPISVTRTSVTLRHPGGELVAGSWAVQGQTLRFTPAPVLSSDLGDGGFRSGGRMHCEVRGFPYVAGVRSMEGAPLVRTFRSQLQVTDGEQGLFLDETPFSSRPLQFGSLVRQSGGHVVYEGDPLRLVCEEPIDPASLSKDYFWIEQEKPEPKNEERARWEVTARLVRNDPPGMRGQFEPCAIIELIPDSPLRGSASDGSSVSYVLRYSPEIARLTDLGGNSVWQRKTQKLNDKFSVVPTGLGNPDSLRLDFLDDRALTSVRVPWADGTAHAEGGRIVARVPAISGRGHAGEVVLEGEVPDVDVQAHRMTVPKGATARLSAGPGLRLLRSQGLLRVAGSLRRMGSGGDLDPLIVDPDEPAGATASEFLSRAQGADRTWTMLVAGGDLWIEGDVIVDTPLILVAGGRIRIDGKVRSADNQLFLLGEGGSLAFHRALDLVLDPPLGNVLAGPISMALLTSPLPGRVRDRYLWRGLEAGIAPGSGAARVRFLAAGAPLEQSSLVDHPGQLPTDRPLRVLIELDLLDGETWDPPAVDFVSFSWDDR